MTRLLALGLALPLAATAAPAVLSHSGRVLDSTGNPLNGPTTFDIALLDASDDVLWAKTYSQTLDDGYFSVTLSTDNEGDAIDTTWLASDLWVQVTVGTSVLSSQQLVDVPRAALSSHLPLESSGATGACSDPGAVAFDTSQGALRVCDGTTWRFAGTGTNADLVVDSGAFEYANGSVARRCLDYRNPTGGQAPATADGNYRIDPDGPGAAYGEMVVYCDMTRDRGGWTRVSTMQLGSTGCTMGTAAVGDPLTPGRCTKLSDAAINAIASDKLFTVRIPGAAPTYTRYSGSININGAPGTVANRASMDLALAATPNQTAAYGGWRFFGQNNWYQTDMCLGTEPWTARLSNEYINQAGPQYFCVGSCSSNCEYQIADGRLAEVFLR